MILPQSQQQIMDKIIDKLKKILALPERGEQGEAINARIKLENELRKHGLTIEDLRSENKTYRIFPYKNKDEMTLFFQVLISVCGRKSEETGDSRYNSKKKQIYVNLTDLQYIEILNMWEFHRKQLNKEKKRLLRDLIEAYVNKHDIFDPNAEPSQKDDIDWERIARIMKLANGMEDIHYRKSLNK